MSNNEISTHNLTECAYCGADVPDAGDFVPGVDDDEWSRLAALHSPPCEWIETRAHRVEIEEVL